MEHHGQQPDPVPELGESRLAAQPNAEGSPQPAEPPPERLGSLLIRFPAFARTHLVGSGTSAPFWFLLMWLLGISGIIDRFEFQSLSKGEYRLDSWLKFWPVALVGGLIAGFIAYYLQGLFYYIRVRLCDGLNEFGAAANVGMYSGLPVYFATIGVALADCAVYGDAYFTQATNTTLDLLWSVVSLACVGWSISLSYRAARAALDAKRIRAIVFFIVLPAMFYLAVFAAAAVVAFTQSTEYTEFNDEGLRHLERQDYPAAIASFESALEATTKEDVDDRITILQNLATVYENQGDTEQAVAHLRQALAFVRPGTLMHQELEAMIALNENRIRDAIVHFGAVLQSDSENLTAHNHLSLIFLGDYDEGFADYGKALDHAKRGYRASSDPVMQYLAGKALYYQDRYAEAVVQLEAYRTAVPNDADGHALLGLSLHLDGGSAAAVPHLEKAIELDPGYGVGFVAEVLSEARALVP